MGRRHAAAVRAQAVQLVLTGWRPADAAAAVGADTTTVYRGLHAEVPELVKRPGWRCWRCHPDVQSDPGAYAQLLGLYLGDGWLAVLPRGQAFLAITCDDRWPGLAGECDAPMRRVLATSVCRVRRRGCHDVKAYSSHWPCLFPQHRPGRKHERPIVLEPWQQETVRTHPGRLLRGLFHSDGWRGCDAAVHRAEDGFVTRYGYSRYEFTNKSADIRGLCTDALDLLGIAWRRNGPWRISVNRRGAVALLDQHVGPKH